MQAEARSCSGAILGLLIAVVTLQYAVTQFTQLYTREGYSVNYKTEEHFYRGTPLELKVGSKNEQNYEFNLMVTALDTETGRFPEDFQKMGEIRMRLWEHSFKVRDGEDVPVNNYYDILYQACTPE